MADMHSPDKEPLSFQAPRTTVVSLKKEARRLGLPLSVHLTRILAAETSHIELNEDDYQAIKEATALARKTGKRIATVLPGTASHSRKNP